MLCRRVLLGVSYQLVPNHLLPQHFRREFCTLSTPSTFEQGLVRTQFAPGEHEETFPQEQLQEVGVNVADDVISPDGSYHISGALTEPEVHEPQEPSSQWNRLLLGQKGCHRKNEAVEAILWWARETK